MPNSYVQTGLQRGLQLQKNKGTNPFQVGFIGSTDKHDAITLKEKVERDRLNITASGLAAVWAEENTRESIFNALRNKETYATTGSRMSVRFFGGWNLPEEVNFDNNNWISNAYENGVPMGSDFFKRESGQPTFLIQAIKDPDGANLDRIQVIKVWIDPSLSSEKQQKIYNVVWSGNRVLDSEGNLPILIDTTGLNWNTYFHDAIGGVSLEVAWQDPDFNRDQHAAYYLRVLETPNMFIHQQERAWSSPIYYNPSINQDTVTSIQSNESFQFKMYPNPINNRSTLTISFQLNNEKVSSIKIIGLDGRVFMRKDLVSFNNPIKIPINGLSPGIYTVILNDKFTKQLVVQ